MNSINKTLYIPLYGKAYVSRKGLFLRDPKAEEIWAAEGFPLKGKARSKWLAYYMGIRSAVFDQWIKQQMEMHPDAVVLHLGCGMDARFLRLSPMLPWYDVDFSQVIGERKRYFSETDAYRMIAGDVREKNWLQEISQRNHAIVILEGVSMYLAPQELQQLMQNLCAHFERLSLLMDVYTPLAAKMSRLKNPVQTVGVTKVFGMEDPQALQTERFSFVKEHEMTPSAFIQELSGMERKIFQKLYARKISRQMYKLLEYQKA